MRKNTAPTNRSLTTLLTPEQRAHITVTPPPLPTPPQKPTTDHHHAPETRSHQARPGVHTLTFSTGETITITGNGIVGRQPTTDPNYTHTITINDPNKLLSRTHFTFGLTTTGQLWANDHNSSNGTYLNGHPIPPGTRTAIPPGSTLRFGDHTATTA